MHVFVLTSRPADGTTDGFFFSKTQKACVSLYLRSFTKSAEAHEWGITRQRSALSSHTRKPGPQCVLADYSRTRQLSFRVPASIHSSVVCLIVRSSWCTEVASFLKHLAFLSFQISHATTKNNESAPFLLSPCQRLLQRSHHSRRVRPPILEASAPSAASIFHQICRENEHEVMMWSMVSGSWSHK
jgi:hypothetical protein